MGNGYKIRGYRALREFDPYRFASNRQYLAGGVKTPDIPRVSAMIRMPVPASSRSLLTVFSGRAIKDFRSAFVRPEASIHATRIIADNALPLAMIASAAYCLVTGDHMFGTGHAGDLPLEGLLFMFAKKEKKLTKAERKEQEKRRQESEARKRGEPLTSQVKVYSPVREWWVTLTQNGIYAGKNSLMKPIQVIGSCRGTAYEAAKDGDPVSPEWLILMDRLESENEYPTLYKFAIAFIGTNVEGYEEMVKIGRLSDMAQIRQRIDALYQKLFPGAPEFPATRGIWSDLEHAHSGIAEGRTTPHDFFELLIFYVTDLPSRIKFGPDSATLGRLTFTFHELFEFYSASIDEMLSIWEKKIKSFQRREREAAEFNMDLNRAGRDFLQRTDIPFQAKLQIAVAYTLGGYNSYHMIEDEFFLKGHWKRAPEAVIKEAQEIFDRIMRPRIDGTAKYRSILPERKKASIKAPAEWLILSLDAVMTRFDTKRLDPQVSHTFFKKADTYIRPYARRMKRCNEANKFVGSVHPQILDRIFIFEFLEDKRSLIHEGQTLAMILDLAANTQEADNPEAVKALREAITNAGNNPTDLATRVKDIYKKYIPYSGELFAKLDADKRAANEPKSVAARLLNEMSRSNEPADIQAAWERVRSRAPMQNCSPLFDILSTAMSAVDSDTNGYREKYRAWIRWLSSLDRSPDNWQWIERYIGLASDNPGMAPARLEEMFQDMVYPVGFDGTPPRSDGDMAFLRATAFLTPDQWLEFRGTISEMKKEIVTAEKALNERKLPDDPESKLAEELRIVGDENLKRAMETGLTRLLDGSFGTASALTSRSLLRESLSDTNKMFWLVALGTIAAGGASSDKVVTKIFDNLRRLEEARVTGDTLRLAINMESQNNSLWRGAMAEFSTAMRHAQMGRGVEILPSDIRRFIPSPDFRITFSNGWVAHVESKARVFTLDGEKVVKGLIKAADQLFSRKMSKNSGVIDLYLIGAGGNVRDAVGLVERTIRDERYERSFRNVKKVKIFFVDTLNRGWEIRRMEEVRK